LPYLTIGRCRHADPHDLRELLRENATHCESARHDATKPPTGIEPVTSAFQKRYEPKDTLRKTAKSARGPALIHAIDPTDADLTSLIAAWPTIPAAIRAGIVAMVKATGATS
jgi:hypothetical protein